MKIQYISQYPIEQAVTNYCDEKTWKLGHPQHEQHQTNISDYLLQKMEPFIAACKVENRDQARAVFLLKISQNLSITRPETIAGKEELESKIRQKLLGCFPDLILANEENKNGFHLYDWKNAEGNTEVDAKWKVEKNGSFPACVEIDSLRANRLVKKGRATNFLRAIVSTLQEDADPYAKITLQAWTGHNFYYGCANGALTWSRLGFGIKEYTKNDRIMFALCSTFSAIKTWKQKIMESFNPRLSFNYFSSISSQEQLDILMDPDFKNLVNTEIEKCENPWEVSAINIQGIPIGQYIMSSLDRARYEGVLYPNCPQSPGMKQYNKRLLELQS